MDLFHFLRCQYICRNYDSELSLVITSTETFMLDFNRYVWYGVCFVLAFFNATCTGHQKCLYASVCMYVFYPNEWTVLVSIHIVSNIPSTSRCQ